MEYSILHHVFLQNVDYGSGSIRMSISLYKNNETLDIALDKFIDYINYQFKHNLRKDKIEKILKEHELSTQN